MRTRSFVLYTILGFLVCSGIAEENDKSEADGYLGWPPPSEAGLSFVPGIRLTYPQGVAVSGTAWINASGFLTKTTNPDECTGFLLQAEPGYGGIKSGVGFGTVDSMGHGKALKLSYYQTWTDFASLDAGEEYVGLDATFLGYGTSFTLGLYSGLDAKASDVLVSAGWGFGF